MCLLDHLKSVSLLIIAGCIISSCSLFEESPPDIMSYDVVQIKPEIIGGYQALADSVTYPEIAVKAEIDGIVLVKFLVDKTGNPVFNYESGHGVLSGIGGGCDGAAVRGIEKTRFEPGRQKGQNVSVEMCVGVAFSSAEPLITAALCGE